MDLQEVAGFLRARRERLKPTDMGLTSPGRRRTPGLRRDEVADLAGISTEYYTQLEQARGRQPSRRVLGRIADALALSRRERLMLFDLAGIAASYPDQPIRTPSAGVRHLLEHLPDAAVTVLDAKLDLIGWNRVAKALFGDPDRLEPDRRNLARRFFLVRPDEPPHFSMTGDDRYEAFLVAKLRHSVARYPRDPEMRRLIDELLASPAFARRWAQNDAYTLARHLVKTMQHPTVGAIELDCVGLYVPEDDQEVVLLTARPDSLSAARLRALVAG